MATDVAVEIRDAVKDALNAATFSHTFTAACAYDLTAELEDDDGITHVDVAVRSEEGDMETRGSESIESEIDVVVRAKCDVSSTAVLDAYMGLLTQIRDHFLDDRRLELSTYDDAFCVGWARKPAYFPTHITQYRQFTGLLTLQYSTAVEL